MALKGTLKDFGIADILQLIGQQQKTGNLHLKTKEQAVNIAFKDGNIVRGESINRKSDSRDLIGGMLVRAELITERQLEHALDTQKRTLQRLGDVLVDQGMISADKFRQMVQLQTTETLYKLFQWKNGSYEFEQAEVEVDPTLTPLRADAVLMEGFRMVDEWPVVKKRITSYLMTFEKGKELPAAKVAESAAFEGQDFDSFNKPEPLSKVSSQIGEAERTLYALAHGGRTVRKLIELSCLGEFETCKALSNLVSTEMLRAVPAHGRDDDLDQKAPFAERLGFFMGRAAVTLFVLGALALIGTRVDSGELRVGRGSATSFVDPAAQRLMSRQQMSRIEAALEVYRLENGQLPEQLDALVESGLLRDDDLKYPWRDDYYYRRTAPTLFVLLPPLK